LSDVDVLEKQATALRDLTERRVRFVLQRLSNRLRRQAFL
jgi:hypothetical protein